MQTMTPAAASAALDTACGILRGTLAQFTDQFQSSNSEQNFYQPSDNVEWATGFCTGEYWLAWEHTRDDAFRNAALRQVDSFLDRIQRKIDVDNHDMGFLYTPSCVAAYKLTGSETGRTAALLPPTKKPAAPSARLRRITACSAAASMPPAASYAVMLAAYSPPSWSLVFIAYPSVCIGFSGFGGPARRALCVTPILAQKPCRRNGWRAPVFSAGRSFFACAQRAGAV